MATFEITRTANLDGLQGATIQLTDRDGNLHTGVASWVSHRPFVDILIVLAADDRCGTPQRQLICDYPQTVTILRPAPWRCPQ